MELNIVNGGSQVPVAPATPELCSWLCTHAAWACGRCAALLGSPTCGGRMRVVVSVTWRAFSVVKRARSCAVSMSPQSVQRVTQQSKRLAQRVGMDSPFTADQIAWLAASLVARPPLPSSAFLGPPAGRSVRTVTGESAPLSVPAAGTSSAPPLTGSAPLPGSSSSSGTCLPMFTCVSVGHGFLPGGGMTGVLEPRMAPGGKTGPAPFPLLITPPQRVA